MLNDPLTVRRVSEFEAENVGVLLCLLEAVARILVSGLGLHNGDRKIRPVPQEVVRALLRATARLVTGNDDAAVGEGFLLADAVVVPPCRLERREYIIATS